MSLIRSKHMRTCKTWGKAKVCGFSTTWYVYAPIWVVCSCGFFFSLLLLFIFLVLVTYLCCHLFFISLLGPVQTPPFSTLFLHVSEAWYGLNHENGCAFSRNNMWVTSYVYVASSSTLQERFCMSGGVNNLRLSTYPERASMLALTHITWWYSLPFRNCPNHGFSNQLGSMRRRRGNTIFFFSWVFVPCCFHVY